ncbi:hypothetical protein BGW41_003322 [Actinomortierella wolfii]|nr:hypothetical protein BGW41_003322 [Actinomortierella wolfii]
MATTATAQPQECVEFIAAEGKYDLQQNIFLEQVAPHATIPTSVSLVSVKYKDYQGNHQLSSNSSNYNIAHSKHTSAESTVSSSNLDRLDEQLKELRMAAGESSSNDATGGSDHQQQGQHSFSRNFHGNLVNLPLYGDDGTTGLNSGSSTTSGVTSPRHGTTPLTPGPPPLKDTTTSASQQQPPPPPLSSSSASAPSSTKSWGRRPSVGGHHLSYQQQPPHSHYQGSSEETTTVTSHGSSSVSSSSGFSSFFSTKRKKPKNNIAKTNSTFVAKITTNENLAKILANRVNEDVYLFWNTGRTFTWSDLGQKPNEPLSHISFSKAFPTSHDVNLLTRSCDHLDVIIGFSTGDIIWFDPLCNKYYRLNKQAIIKDSGVTMIRWMPGSEGQFMAAFQDGSIVIMDKERDDYTFTTPPVQDDHFHVTRPKHSKHNPISHWQVSRKPITAFAFSPDLQHVAVVGMDGCMRIIDFRNERLLDTFQSYFGALSCTGGQDDLVTIWSFKDQRIVARCQGHQSYVTGVAFDPWRCDERNYRFGSAAMQRRGSNATVTGGVGGAFKPGHGHKSSITSLRGIGGHSLFGGANKQQSQQQHQQHQQPPQSTHPHSHSLIQTTVLEDPRESSLSVQENASLRSKDSQHLAESNSFADRSSISTTSSIQSSTVSEPTLTSEAHPGATMLVNGVALPATAPASSASSFSSQSNHHHPHHPHHLHHPHQTNHSQSQPPQPQQQQGGHGSSLAQLYSQKFKQGSGKQGTQTSAPLSINTRDVSNNNSAVSSSGGRRNSHGAPLSASSSGVGGGGGGPILYPLVRPPEPRSHVAMLQPLMSKNIHVEPLSTITFREDAILTSDRRGHIKVWKRPSPLPAQ